MQQSSLLEPPEPESPRRAERHAETQNDGEPCPPVAVSPDTERDRLSYNALEMYLAGGR